MINLQESAAYLGRSKGVYVFLALLFGVGIGLSITFSTSPLIVAALIVGGVFAVITLVNVELGLLLVILMLYLRISDIAVNVYGLPSVARPFIAFLIAAAIIRWTVTKNWPGGWLRAFLLVGLYGIVVFTSMFYAADFTRATAAISTFIKDAIIAILITMLVQRGPTLRRVAWVLIIAGIFTGTISVYQYLTGTFDNTYWGFAQAPVLNIIGETESNRVAGMLGSPNYYAQILIILVPLAINQLWDERSLFLKLMAGWSVFVCLLSVIFTFSRGGFIALLVTLITVIIYRKLKLPFVLLMIFFGILVLRLVPNPFFERLSTIPDAITGQISYVDEVSFRGRVSELIVAVEVFLDHPIVGVGVDNYPVYYQEYSRRVGLDPRTEQRQAHNLFLRTAAETGILGLLTFGLILWVAFKSVLDAWRLLNQVNLHKYANLVAAFGISMLGFLTDAMFTHNAFPRYFWILVGICFALPQVARNTITENHEVPGSDGLQWSTRQR